MLPMPAYFRQDIYPRLPALIKKFGPTFLLYNRPGIFSSGYKLTSAFSRIYYRQYYAVKALPDPMVLDALKSLGFGFDCSSIPELLMARALGARGEDIIFSSNDTSEKEFIVAAKNGGCELTSISTSEKSTRSPPK